MTRIEILVRESELPIDAEPMARITLSTGNELDLTLKEWEELAARLEIGRRG